MTKGVNFFNESERQKWIAENLKTSEDCAKHYNRKDVAATPQELKWIKKQFEKFDKKHIHNPFNEKYRNNPNFELILKQQNCFPEDYADFAYDCEEQLKAVDEMILSKYTNSSED